MEDQAQAFRDYGVRDKDIIEMDCVYAGWQGWREVRWPERDASIRFGRSLAAVGVSDDDRLHKAAAASLASSTRKDTGTETVVTSAEEETPAAAVSPQRAALQASRDAAKAAESAVAEVRALVLGMQDFSFASARKQDGTQPRGGFLTTPAAGGSDEESDISLAN